MMEGSPFKLSPLFKSGRADFGHSSHFCTISKSNFAANIVDNRRVRLKPENVNLVIFLRGNKDFLDLDNTHSVCVSVLLTSLN